MHNRYPLWKYLVIVAVIAIAGVFAFPNLYPDDLAIQISSLNAGQKVTQAQIDKITDSLDKANIIYKKTELTEKQGLIRFSDNDSQLKAQPLIKQAMGDNYVVALNLAPTTPDWLRNLGATPIKLGLDLSGGVHFLMEVDISKALSDRYKDYQIAIKRHLQENSLKYKKVTLNNDSIEIQLASADNIDDAKRSIQKAYPEFIAEDQQRADATTWIKLTVSDSKINEITDYAITQNLTTLRNRINELGVAEPLIQRQGRSRIVIELPGVQDTAQAKRILGKTANLEFRLEAPLNEPSYNTERFPYRNQKTQHESLSRQAILSGQNVMNAQSNFDENGRPAVNITLDSEGGDKMFRATKDRINSRMAVLFIEQKTNTTFSEDENGKLVPNYKRYEEKSIISFAVIRSALGRNFQISGLESAAESSELALLLRAGALAAPMYFVEERTIGPSLGQENINQGVLAILIGFAAVLIFMLVTYKLFGLFANVALALNLVLIIAFMSMIPGAVLTLPGIAGIVLTVGMAVDANVLIFSRIREELKNGLTPHAAINAGYDRAFVTILDANITTLLVALILFAFGSGPIKGFAVTLSIGILTSMFTAIMLTRSLVGITLGGRPLKKLSAII